MRWIAATPGTVYAGRVIAHEPIIIRTGDLCAVKGIVYRAVDKTSTSTALLGSNKAGRYSRPEQPTLYLSASQAGVDAAMIAHRDAGDTARTVLSFRVEADDICDLRDPDLVATVRNEAGNPFADWQSAVAHGAEPASWRVRDWIEARGARGLIDPSRKAPGLWHLVLFRWNVAGFPTVVPINAS